MATINKAVGGNLTTEQILAIQVNNSADAVEILKGKSAQQQAASGSVNVEVKIGPEIAELNKAKDEAAQQTIQIMQEFIRAQQTHSEQTQKNFLEAHEKTAKSNAQIAQSLGNSHAPASVQPSVTPVAAQPAPQYAYQAEPQTLVFKACPNCSKNNMADARYCSHCRHELI